MSTATLAIQIRAKHPEYTLQNIATETGVTRERVRQILMKADLPTSAVVPKKPHRYCVCGKQTPRFQLHCSKECRTKTKYMKIPCGFCGVDKEVLRSNYLWRVTNLPERYTGQAFCNRECMGKWLGKHHGRGTSGNPGVLKTHCKNNHEFTEDNTYSHVSKHTGLTSRQCRACVKDRKETHVN